MSSVVMARPKEHLLANASAAFLVKCEKERTRLIQKLTDQYRFDLNSLLEDNSQADLTVVLPGETFHLHSAILRGRCNRFYEEFLDSQPQGTTKDVDFENVGQLRDVIRAIYTSDDLSAVDLVLAKWMKKRKRNSDSACSAGDLVLDFADQTNDPNGNVCRKSQGMDLLSPDVDIKLDDFKTPSCSTGDLMTPFDPNLDFEAGLKNRGYVAEQKTVGAAANELMTVDGPAAVGCCKVADDLLSMFRNSLYTDVVILADGREFKAHRCILTARSTYFAAMLSGSWVESESQTIKLEGLNASVVEQILLCLYGSASVNLRDCKVMELVAAADMYTVNSVKDIVSYELKMDYCHFFHRPCSGCVATVPEAMPLAYTYGLNDVLDRCYKWNARHFVRLWPTKHFAILPQEILSECCRAVVDELTCDNVIDVALDYERLMGSLPHGRQRWATPIVALATKLKDEFVGFLKNHLTDVVSTDKFRKFGTTNALGLSLLEDVFSRAIMNMPPEKAPETYCKFVQLDEWASRFPEGTGDCNWTEEFRALIKSLRQKCQQYVNLHIQQLVVTESWKKLPTELQNQLKEGAFYVDVKHIKKKEPPKRRDHKIAMYGRVQKPKDAANKGSGSTPRPSSKKAKPKSTQGGSGAEPGATVLPSPSEEGAVGGAEAGSESGQSSSSAASSVKNKAHGASTNTAKTEATLRLKSGATRKIPAPSGQRSTMNSSSLHAKAKPQNSGQAIPTKSARKESQPTKKQLGAHKDEPCEKKPKTSGETSRTSNAANKHSLAGKKRSGIPALSSQVRQHSRESDDASQCSHLAAQGSQCVSLDDVSMGNVDSVHTSGVVSPAVDDPYPVSDAAALEAAIANDLIPGSFRQKVSIGNNHLLADEDSVSLCSHRAVRGSPPNSGNSSPTEFGADYATVNGPDLSDNLDFEQLSTNDPASAGDYHSQVECILATVEAVHFEPEPMVSTFNVQFDPPPNGEEEE